MTAKLSNLDCIIVGYHNVELAEMIQALDGTRQYSGAYHALISNSVPYDGKRLTYFDLLNQVLTQATGRDHHWHVSQLPNLAACYLKSFLNRRQLNVEIINYFTQEKGRFAELLAGSPATVAITTTFYTDNRPIIEIIEFIRRHNSDTKIVLGGPYIYSLASTQDARTQDYVFKSIGADIYVVESQGEHTLSLLVSKLREGKNQDLGDIPNLVYTTDNQTFQRTKRIIENNSLDENSIDWQYFEKEFYTPTVYMRTARGCSFACSFCRFPALGGPPVHASLETVEKEMKGLASDVKNLVFIDDTFNVPLPRFKELCRMIIRNHFDFEWFSYFRCANADDEAFDLMQASGCRGVFLGIESGDQQILNNMNKFATVEKYAAGIRKLEERGIFTFASLIIGFPGESEASVQNTIAFIEAARPSFYRAELYYHDGLVPIQQQAEKYGLKGAGYGWRHRSMDWRKASQLIEQIYKTISGSMILPIYMFDFWSLPYLLGKGLTWPQITGFIKIANKMLVQGFDVPHADTTEHERELLSLFSEQQT